MSHAHISPLIGHRSGMAEERSPPVDSGALLAHHLLCGGDRDAWFLPAGFLPSSNRICCIVATATLAHRLLYSGDRNAGLLPAGFLPSSNRICYIVAIAMRGSSPQDSCRPATASPGAAPVCCPTTPPGPRASSAVSPPPGMLLSRMCAPPQPRREELTSIGI